MIYSVSIYDKDGTLKNTISAKKLLKRHWDKFHIREESPKKFVKGTDKSRPARTSEELPQDEYYL